MPAIGSLRLTTAAQLFSEPSDGYRYDLFEGTLEMMFPAGSRHGRVTFRLSYLLNQHVEAEQLGVVFAAETGFLLAENPDTVLAPDVAFVSSDRYAAVEDDVRFVSLAPDLAVEVLSPNDRFTRVEAKALAWLDAGTKLVLLVDSEQRMVHAYRSTKDIQIFSADEVLDCGDAVPGWRLVVQELFEIPGLPGTKADSP